MEKYLQRKIEPFFPNKINKEEARALEEPIFKIFWEQEGDIKLENDKIRLELSYEKADYQDYIEGPDELHGLLGEFPPSSNYRKLNKFVMQDLKTKEKLDILEDVPSEFSFVFMPDYPEYIGHVSYSYKGSVVLGNILTLRGIIISLHEIGHFVDLNDDENKEGPFKISAEQAKTEEELAEVLRSERAASAYALKKIKPFLDEDCFPKDLVLKEIHISNLYEHSKSIRKREALLKMKKFLSFKK
jgi:hypothetical protein